MDFLAFFFWCVSEFDKCFLKTKEKEMCFWFFFLLLAFLCLFVRPSHSHSLCHKISRFSHVDILVSLSLFICLFDSIQFLLLFYLFCGLRKVRNLFAIGLAWLGFGLGWWNFKIIFDLAHIYRVLLLRLVNGPRVH